MDNTVEEVVRCDATWRARRADGQASEEDVLAAAEAAGLNRAALAALLQDAEGGMAAAAAGVAAACRQALLPL